MPLRTTLSAIESRKARLVKALAIVCVCTVCPALRAQGDALSQAALAAKTSAAAPAAARRRAQAFVRGRTNAVPGQGAAALANARLEHLRLAATPKPADLTSAWTPMGPVQLQSERYGLVTGRVTSVAIDPVDASGNTVYVGTSGGGVWKSTNAAGAVASVTFSPLTDTLPVYSQNAGTSVIPSLSIGAMSVQPGGTGVVLAGTGDSNNATDSYYGSGLLRSADNGLTWSLVQYAADCCGVHSFIGQGFAALAWSTATPQLAVAAVSSSAESAVVGGDVSPGVRGLYYSSDSGATWHLATIQDGSTVVQDQYTNYNSFRGNAATAVVWNPIRNRFYAAVRYHGYYESTDGMMWTRLVNQPGAGLTTTNCPTRSSDYGAQSCPLFRGALAVQPASGDLFALTIDGNDGDQGLRQDVCALSGSSCSSSTVAWATKLNATPMEDSGAIDQGDYNLTLAAVPAATALSTNDTLLFAGAGDLYRCTLAGGCTLRNTTNTSNGCASPAGVAPAQHAVAWSLNASNTAAPLLYFGNDGGLWRSTDGLNQTGSVCSANDASHFDNLNGAVGSLAEISGMSSHPSNANVMLAALGENGSAASYVTEQASNQYPWTQLSAGESGYVAIDQGNGNIGMAQSGAGIAVHTCSNGTACTAADFAGPAQVGLAQTSNDFSLIDPPVVLDPALNSNLIAGTCRVWRGPTSGGSAWSNANAISPFMAGPASSACTGSDATIRSLAAGGAVQLTGSTQTSGSPVLYAGLSGAADGASIYGGHLFRTLFGNSADSSTAWTDVATSTVTNDPAGFNPGGFDISSIAVDPNDPTGHTVYAAILGFGYPHLYRSTDAGATWANVSANLPNAPANAVAVDPNNANIVYVALDTGVYATTSITSCIAPSGTTVNCWSVMGTSLPNAPVLSLVATSGITTPGALASGVLRAGTYGRGIWQQSLLSAGTASLPVATFSPSSLTFSSQNVGTTSAAQTATLTNTGASAMVISGVSASSGFIETDTCSGTTVAVGGTCSLTVSFAPVAAGSATGAVQVVANVAGGYAALPLTGAGIGVSNLALAPTSLTFASTAVGSTSAAQVVTATNKGTATATLSTPTTTQDFHVSSTTCGTSLAVNASCTISVNYAPTAVGLNSGTLTLADATASHTVALNASATGNASITVTPPSLSFGDQPVGTNSGAQTVTVTNAGTALATLGAPTIKNSTDFAVRGDTTCLSTLPANTSCIVQVISKPSSIGPTSGTLSLIAAGTTYTVSLTGSGIGPIPNLALSPASLTFPATAINVTTLPQAVTVTNLDNFPLDLSSAVTQVAGDFGVQSTTCAGATVNAGESCTLNVVYDPSVAGKETGQLVYTYRGTSYAVQLSGTGIGTSIVTVSPSALVFPSTNVSATSTPLSVTVSTTGNTPSPFGTPVVSGDFALAGTTRGASMAVGASCSVSVVFKPTANGPRTGALTMTDASGTQTVALSGNGVGIASVSVAPGSMVFASTAVNSTSAAQTVTVNNAGTAATALSAPTLTGDFALVGNTCTNSIAAGGSCTLSIVFTPTAAGIRTGTATVTDGSNATHAVTLSGNGVGTANVSLTPASLVFPSTAINGTSATQSVTVSNTGTAAIGLNAPTITGDFSVAGNTCGAALAAGASCSIAVSFTPTANGFRGGTLALVDASSASHTVTLSGNGVGTATVSLTPPSLVFAATAVNSTSTAQAITVSNSGTAPVGVAAPALTGDFALTADTCGATLAVGASCSLSVIFTPTATGARSGTLTLTDASPATHTVALSGTGMGVANVVLAPTSLVFASTAISSTTAAQNVTVSNTGTGSIGLSSPVLTGDFSLNGNTCSVSLAAGAFCTLSVVFTPSGSGPRTGTLTLNDASPATHTISLSGTGVGTAILSFSPLSLAFPTTAVNSTSSALSTTVSNSGTAPIGVATPVVTGDFALVGNTCGTSISVGTTCSLSAVFTPTQGGSRTGALMMTDAAGTIHSVGLSGTGTGVGATSLSPATLVFATTNVNSTSSTQILTVSNTGTGAVGLNAPVLTGDFSLAASTCVATLAAGSSCMYLLRFTPTADGPRSGALTLTDASPATHTATLSGNGVGIANITAAPTTLIFSATPVNSTSATQAVAVNNTGTAAIAVNAPTVTGDFAVTGDTCPASIAAGASCAISVIFAPTANGVRNGLLTISESTGSQTIVLSGTGTGVGNLLLTPAALTFASTAVHTTTAAQTATVSNVGTAAIGLTSPVVAGDFTLAGNACGVSLAAGASCAMSVSFTPSASGPRSGTLTLTDAAAAMHTVTLSGAGVAGVLSPSASAIPFADTNLNATSPAQTLTVTNTGTGTLNISGTSVTGDFAASGGCAGVALAPSKSCTVSLTFTPTAIGARIGTLTLTSDSGGTAGILTTIALTGNGKGAFYVVLLPTSVNFGTQIMGTTRAVTNITISNTGTISGTIQSISVSGDFHLSANTCGTTLAPQTGCTVSIVFTPTAGGTRTGLLTVVDDAGTQTASLTGTGTAAATDTLTPLALTFPTQQVNTASPAQSVTLTNSGDTPLTLVAAQILAGDFTAVNNCGPTLPAHSTCSISATFVPKSVGALTGTLQVSDVQHIQTVALNGTSIAGPGVSLLPSNITFAATGVGVASAAQIMTLTNNGGIALQLSSVAVTGDFGIVAGSNACSLTAPIAVGGSCSLQVAFVPTTAGARTGTVTVLSNAPTQTAQLAGTGVDFALVPNGPTSLSIASGANAVFPLLMRPVVNTSNPVTYTCSGAPANSKCTIVSQYSDLSATGTVTVTILTGTTASTRGLAMVLVPLLGLLPLWARRRQRYGTLLALVMTVLLLGTVSCGYGRATATSGSGTGGGGTTTPPTPSGSYTITASATAAGVTHSVPLTLTIQ